MTKDNRQIEMLEFLENMHTFLEKTLKYQHKRYILGIDGLSRSGKTTVANYLKSILNRENQPVYLFHLDNYIVEKERRYQTGHEEWYEYYELQWDVPWLKEYFFEKLKEHKQLQLPTYNGKTDTHTTKVVNISDKCLIIVEGVFLQRKEWRNYFDYLILIDSQKEKRFNREQKTTQLNVGKFLNRYWKAEDYYLNTINPAVNANLVIKN
jgi:uridine kinase